MLNIFNKPFFWWIGSIVGFDIITICYIYAWQGMISYLLFWSGLGLGCFSFLLIILLSKTKIKTLYALFMLGIIIYSLQIYRTPEYLNDRDEMMHYQGYTYIT